MLKLLDFWIWNSLWTLELTRNFYRHNLLKLIKLFADKGLKLISLYRLRKKLCYNGTVCQRTVRTRLSSCRKLSSTRQLNSRVRTVHWHTVLFKRSFLSQQYKLINFQPLFANHLIPVIDFSNFAGCRTSYSRWHVVSLWFHITYSTAVECRAVFVRFSLGGQSFDWRLATIAGMEIAKLVPWNSLLN